MLGDGLASTMPGSHGARVHAVVACQFGFPIGPVKRHADLAEKGFWISHEWPGLAAAGLDPAGLGKSGIDLPWPRTRVDAPRRLSLRQPAGWPFTVSVKCK